jgi:hypothetical protein
MGSRCGIEPEIELDFLRLLTWDDLEIMKLAEHRAEQDLPELCDWLSRLLILIEEMTSGIECSEENHLGFMALCFLSKQIDHARSVLALIPSRDAVLIARSMIEGLAQLLWAASKPDVLPLQWRAFVWVHDWRFLQEKEKNGEGVDEARRIIIDDALREFGEPFLKKKEKGTRDSGGIMSDDPYHDNWRAGYTIKNICKDVEGEDMYDLLYGPFSDWHHWGVASLGQCLNRQNGHVSYSSLSHSDSARALAVAFQCVLQTAELIEDKLAIGVGPKLSELRNDYIRVMGGSTTA